MKFLRVLYYHYYIFYRDVLPLGYIDLRFNVLTIIGVCSAFILLFFLDMIAIYFFCYNLPPLVRIIIPFGFIFGVGVLIDKKEEKKILKEKPIIFSRKMSIVIALSFFIVSLTLLILAGVIGREVLSKC